MGKITKKCERTEQELFLLKNKIPVTRADQKMTGRFNRKWSMIRSITPEQCG